MVYIRKEEVNTQCEVCGEIFGTAKSKKTCSEDCQIKRVRRLTGREAHHQLLPSATVGAMSEMIIAIELMKKGYAVFRALSAACFCDLVVSKGNSIYKIECRTGYLNMQSKSLAYSTKVRGDIDLFAVYVYTDNTIRYLYPDGKTEFKI
jgi:predicted nucleic acid-binding Zn ribbon protein